MDKEKTKIDFEKQLDYLDTSDGGNQNKSRTRLLDISKSPVNDNGT